MMILYLECYLLIEGASGCSLDFLRANKGMKLRLVRTRESPKNFHDCKELGKMQRHDHFSEKFLELSLWACPCRRAASCQLFFGKSGCGSAMSKFILSLLSPCTDFAQEKVMGHTAATCKEHSERNQTHTSLSECLFNENRSKTFSKTSIRW